MSNRHNSNILKILLVEDSKSDAYLIQETLNESKIPHQLSWVKNGVEALDFLCKRSKYAHVPLPDLILLDLNMPKKNGQEVLVDLKANDDLKNIPVVVITTSARQEDIAKVSQIQASYYLVKPVEFEQLISVVRSLLPA
ncbi:MAG: response regulator [Leptolyngbyaceae cyanobacterium CSU_1_4]|nr:response regulator [Leptolyngbyaceae cyanobacterium CSU_1_4]